MRKFCAPPPRKVDFFPGFISLQASLRVAQCSPSQLLTSIWKLITPCSGLLSLIWWQFLKLPAKHSATLEIRSFQIYFVLRSSELFSLAQCSLREIRAFEQEKLKFRKEEKDWYLKTEWGWEVSKRKLFGAEKQAQKVGWEKQKKVKQSWAERPNEFALFQLVCKTHWTCGRLIDSLFCELKFRQLFELLMKTPLFTTAVIKWIFDWSKTKLVSRSKILVAFWHVLRVWEKTRNLGCL